MKSLRLHSAVMALVLAMLWSHAWGQETPVWEQAKKTYESAMSQYRASGWQQAQGLLEEFIKNYPTNENIPAAYVQLANCRAQQKNFAGADESLNMVIKKFQGSGMWVAAHMSKLSRLKLLKKHDEYLTLLDSMMKVAKELPLELNNIRIDPGFHWIGTHWRSPRYGNSMPWNLEPIYDQNWLNDVLAVCDTQDRAQRALKSLGNMFRKKNDINRELNSEWEFFHYRLLLAAGKDDEAAKAMAAYRQDWGDDPRGIPLALLHAEYLQQNGDAKGADAAYDYIIATYGNFGSVSYYLATRMKYLADHERLADLNKLGEYYLKEFPQGPHRRALLGWQADAARRMAMKDPNLTEEAVKLVREYYGKTSLQGIQIQIDLALAQQKPQEAVEAAKAMLDDACWSQNCYNMMQNYSANKPLQPLLEEMEKKYNIPKLDANSAPGLLLKTLKDRIKEEQVRFMEEVGKEMIEKYPQDAATIQGVKLLADYYFDKLLPEPRDRWTNLMISNYPRHPLTQAVMASQIKALKAAKQYQQFIQAVDEFDKRFPTSGLSGQWAWDKFEAYDGAKDAEGKMAWARKWWGAAADAGDAEAIFRLGDRELAAVPADSNSIGLFWMEKAKKYEGQRAQLYCWYRAYDAYFLQPAFTVRQNREVMSAEALEVLQKLSEQKIDPEIRWYLEFADITVAAVKGDAKAVHEAATKRLTAKKYRGLSLRVNMGAIATAFNADPKLVPAGMEIAQKMEKVCYTDRDTTEINAMMGAMYLAVKNNAKAVECYRKTLEDAAWPAQVYPNFVQALKAADLPQVPTLVNMYLAKIANVQELYPKVLWDEAEYLMAKGKDKSMSEIMAIRQKLAQSYPASEARGKLEARLAQDQQPKK